MLKSKQYRTTVLFMFILLGCLTAAYYLRSQGRVIYLQPTPVVASAQLAGQEQLEALKQLENFGEYEASMLNLQTASETGLKAELVFEGMIHQDLMEELLNILAANAVPASFFASGPEIAAYTDSLLLVADRQYPVGLSSDLLTSGFVGSGARQLAVEFAGAGSALQTTTGLRPYAILASEMPEEDLRMAAYAASFDTLVVPTKTVQASSLSSFSNTERLIDGLPRGAILCLRLEGLSSAGMGNIEKLCVVLSQSDLVARAQNLLARPYEPADELHRVYTSERAAALTFAGLGDEEELHSLLRELDSQRAVVTFFVLEEDLRKTPEQIRAIVDGGHALGVAVNLSGSVDAEDLLVEILTVEEALRDEYSLTGKLPVRPYYGKSQNSLQQACGAGGYVLLSEMVTAILSDDMRKTDPSALLEERFPKEYGALQRGEIVHFQMKQFRYSNDMLGGYVREILSERNIYEIKPVMEILSNVDLVYEYPLRSENILPQIRDAIYPGQLKGDPMAAIQAGYIGISWVNTPSFLPGFTAQEIRSMDKKGVIPNSGNRVFLSFDDWGTDAIITSLLDVLKKYDAKATFFVRTEFVPYNPNLLRAIALEGHSIGSHTRTHYPLSHDTGNGKKFTELLEAEVTELTEDLVASHQDLQKIIGDISVDGRPVLTKLFRPPTLAVGKNGLTAVLDCGYTHSVSGTYTSQDYKATDPKKLADALKRNTKDGAILIMHMSDTSVHTAEALDLYLSEMASRTASSTFRFAGLGEGL